MFLLAADSLHVAEIISHMKRIFDNARRIARRVSERTKPAKRV